MRTLFALILLLTVDACNAAAVITPEQFGALGDGVRDDTLAVEKALFSAGREQVPAVLARTYRLTRQITIRVRTSLEGGGTLLATPGIEASIGVSGTDSLLRFTLGASESSIRDLTIDLGNQGRTALRIEAPGMTISNVSIVNYRKISKADNKTHSKSESGIRISASNVSLQDIHCENMVTLVMDAVPRCITIHGGAKSINITDISAKNVNGGITVGASESIRVTNVSFNGLSDNGFYLLPGSSDFEATGGTMTNVNEAIVFKGHDARIIGLSIHNQQQGIGLENADGILLKGLRVTHDDELQTTPSFIRTRPGNRSSTNIVLEGISADIPLGSSVLNLAVGAVSNFTLLNSVFDLHVSASQTKPAFLLRQNDGTPPDINNTTFHFVGEGSNRVRSTVLKAPQLSKSFMEQFEINNQVLHGDEAVLVRSQNSGRPRQVQ